MKNSLEEVYDSSIKFLVPLNLEATFKVVIREALRIVRGDAGSIFLLEDGRLKRVYSTNPKLYTIEPRKRGYTYQVYKEKQILLLSAAQIAEYHPEIKNTEIKHDILIPLIYKNKSFGVLSILSKDRKFNESDISKLNLLTPLASLAIRKAQLYRELNHALKTRDLFISMASHELKTPITTIYTYLQLIKNRSEKGKKYDPEWIETLLMEMNRLTKLINELLQINQIKTGDFKYDWEEVNIIDILKKAEASFRARYKKTELDFVNKTGLPKIKLIGDPNKLIQVITNLLDNSEKHNLENHPITLTLNKDKRNIKILIEDRGSGIHRRDLDKVFQEFYKGRGHTKSGMGLGLFLIKKIVDKHKGKIKISSEINKGTSVSIKLPLLKYGA